MDEMRPECLEWFVKLTEANQSLDTLVNNHYTDVLSNQCVLNAKQDMTWKVVALVGLSHLVVLGLVTSILVLVVL